jgi:DeoR/GlpR family transcriptional regulator of sugar metabolism
MQSERDAVILQILRQRGTISVADCAAELGCAQMTVRRDLQRLEERGLLRRVHGGATRVLPPAQPIRSRRVRGLLEARAAVVDHSDVLIITPTGATAINLLAERARRASTPCVSEAIRHPGTITQVSIDDYQAGLELGRWVGQYSFSCASDRLHILVIGQDLPNTEARSRGFCEGLRVTRSDSCSFLHVCSDGLRQTARRLANEALSLHAEINVIFGINDDCALGGLDAYRALGMAEAHLLVATCGVEGSNFRHELQSGGPCKVGLAMFPEAVGRACIDAAVCAFNRCPLPERIITPFAIVTAATLEQYYTKNPDTDTWAINWPVVEHLTTASTGYALLMNHHHRAIPAQIGYALVYNTHDWYVHVRRAMDERCRSLGIRLETMDASHDLSQEIVELQGAIGWSAARFVKPGDTIIVNAGLATTALACALHGRTDTTIISNSLAVLVELAEEPGITLLAPGGQVRGANLALSGATAVNAFKQWHANKSFITDLNLSLDLGLSCSSLGGAAMIEAMLGAADEITLLADHTRIGIASLVRIAPIERVHRLITDAGISAHDRQAITERGVQITIAGDRDHETLC